MVHAQHVHTLFVTCLQLLMACSLNSLSPSEVEKVVDSVSLTRRKCFQKLGLAENIWENIMG